MPHRVIGRIVWATPGEVTNMVLALTGLIAALTALWKAMHTSNRLTSLENGTGVYSGVAEPASAHDPEPRAPGKG